MKNPKPRKRIRIRVLRGAFGTYAPDTGEIEISRKLTNRAIPSKPFVLNHEIFHSWLHSKDIALGSLEEEQLADIYACSTER